MAAVLMSAFDRYVAAWNAGDLEGWLDTQDPAVEYVSLASADAVTYRGHEAMRGVWRESRANWEAFRFRVIDTRDGPGRQGTGERAGIVEVGFSGVERLQRIEINGVLWFRFEARDARIARLWSALEAADLGPG